jgi:hypothetical protein
VRATFVIILTPFTDGFPGMIDVNELVFIQVFIAKASVKTLNKSVLCRLAGLDKTQLHAMLKGPLIERAAGKFRALINSYRSRIAEKQRNTVQNARPEIPKATVTVRHSFVKSSTQVRHLILRPVASASMTKSIDQVRLGAAGRSSRRSVASPLRRRLRLTPSPFR